MNFGIIFKKIKSMELEIDQLNKKISSHEGRINNLLCQVSQKENVLNERTIQVTKDITQQIRDKEFFKEKRYSNDDLLLEYKRFESYLLNNLLGTYDLNYLSDLKQFIIENRYSIENFYNRKRIGINFNSDILLTQLNEIINSFRALHSGAKAEEDTRVVIATFDHKVKYLVNHRCCARKTQDENVIYAENDIIIVCKKGIFTLEIKNSSSDLEITSNGDLVRIKSGKRENIVEQCLRHVNITQRVLEEELEETYPQVKDIVVEPIIIIANNAIELKNNCKRVPVLIKSEIQDYILSTYQPKRILTEDEVNLYFDTLKLRQEEPAKFKHSVNVDILNSQLPLLIYYMNLRGNLNVETQKILGEIQEIKKNIQKEENILNTYKRDLNLRNNELLNLTTQRNKILNSIIFGVDVLKSVIKNKVSIASLVIFLVVKIIISGVDVLSKFQSEKLLDELAYLRQSEILDNPISLEAYEHENLELTKIKTEITNTNNFLTNKLDSIRLNDVMFMPETKWTGTGVIDGKEITAEIIFENSKAIFSFETEGENVGSFSLIPTVDKTSGYIKLLAMEWINPSTDFYMFDLVGLENQGMMFLIAVRDAFRDFENNGEFKFIKE
ncbi:nuclease-related domain-containing protein [Turicibacter sp. H121]|uniref:nuclease-related domain-containing protein n=1 Tax=Turicibacter sp. H121 TaxID=1712675 RepID=UPI0007630F3B|nr:nuclease-related domain-containing protein [Turicibacter sp. H121]AMC08271.1 hypothetical protein AT726_04440 [Turicibacter sp. H121]MCU7200154.1 NERD domain-containing protein [Turicibacter sp. H121]